MPGPAYELTGGPCHWDLALTFEVAIGKSLALNKRCIDGAVAWTRPDWGR
jgi:hypothetical protein